jgi:RimJ/RimL family protein N-acetyltransferase
MTIQETERLIIRKFTLEDADFILRLMNEPSFIENIADRGVRTREQAAAYLAEGPLAMYRQHGHGLYCVELKATGAPIGMCGLLKREQFQDVDLGYAFLPEHCGRGYATEAGAAVLAYGHAALGLAKVIAITRPGNDRSGAVLTRLGFRSLGLARTPLRPEQEALYEYCFPQ